MQYFWNTVLAINSVFWFLSLGFLAYAFGRLIIALDWKQFLFAAALFIAVSLSEVTLTAVAHE